MNKTWRQHIIPYFKEVVRQLLNNLVTAGPPELSYYGCRFDWSGLEVDLRFWLSTGDTRIVVRVSREEDEDTCWGTDDVVGIEDDDTPKIVAANLAEILHELEKRVGP